MMHPSQNPTILWSSESVALDHDCACATVTPHTQTSKLTESSWLRADKLHRQPLSAEQTLVFAPRGRHGVYVLNRSALQLLDTFSQPRRLTNETEQLLAEHGLLTPLGAPETLPDEDSDRLVAWLHVTNACNLRCVYCYLDKTEEEMDYATGQAAIDSIIRSAKQNGYRRVQLKYAGGEATLSFERVQHLHAYAIERMAEADLTLEAVVLSNGVALSRRMLLFLDQHNIQLMISLDGLGKAHDQQRPFINGRGSSNQVKRSVDRALDVGIKPHLSLTVTGYNVDELVYTVEFALERGLRFNLNFYRDHDPKQTTAELRAGDERLISAIRAVFKVIEQRLPQESLIGSLLDRSNFTGAHQHSCGAGRDYLVIDQRGGVSRCQMEIEQTVTTVEADDPLKAVRGEPIGFVNMAADEKEGCRQCEWKYWCAGGCPLLTYRVTGRNDVKSPYCNVYKTLYPELLRLEGLRLLKWLTPTQRSNKVH